MVDMGTFFLIIEIDEGQHRRYNQDCERARVVNLHVDVGQMPIIVVRFNPDKFMDAAGRKHASCWGSTKTLELCKVVHPQQWQARLAALESTIKATLDAALAADPASLPLIQTVHLFFDGYVM